MPWREWIDTYFAPYTTAPMAERHIRVWEWAAALQPGERSRPIVECWPRGGAKALALDTPIPTPTGWTTMGELRFGSIVLDHRGTPTTVVNMSPIETKSCYRVTFDDGSTILASGDHLWSVMDKDARTTLPDGVDWATATWDATDGKPMCRIDGCERRTRKGTLCTAHAERQRRGQTMTLTYQAPTAQGSPRSAKVLTTEQLLDAGLRMGRERRWAIPTASPFQGIAASLPVHPYVLGAWLGDGHTNGARITVGHEDVDAMQANLVRCGIDVVRYQRESGYELSLVNGTRVALRGIGVLGDKHIPAVYLRASHEQRMSLLRGLLDTDGTAIHRGRAAEFVSNRNVLAYGVRELAHSLGYRVSIQETRARLNGKDCGPLWRLRIAGITPDAFALPRKRDQVAAQETKAHRNTGKVRYIESIERIEDQPVRCIMVDSPGHLFLAGDAWIPTHNSTTIELICAWLASSPAPRRHFALYVSNTQEQANSHVASISGMIEHVGVGRDLNRYGASRGWTRTLLRTNTGFNLMAFGLDTGMRGIKLDRYRPDLIIFDDFDDRHDTDHMIQKKIETITTSILPAESSDCAIIVIQNRIHKKSIMSKLLDGTADFLLDRLPAHEEPAVRDFAYSTAVVAGEPVYDVTGTATWKGQSLATCAHQMRRWGTHAFKREAQHDMREAEGGLWNRARDIDPYRTTQLPAIGLDRICVAIDPSTTSGGDMCGIVVAGTSYEYDGAMQPVQHGYVLDDVSIQGSPNAWATQAVAAYNKYRADLLVAERNNGGDMVTVTINTVSGAPPVVTVWASRGKITRAEPVQKLAENGRIHHVGTFADLEEEMCTYAHKPGQESPNRMDALVWALTTLMIGEADMSDAVGDMMRENEDLYAYVE